jgi:sialidase-1
MTFEHKTYLARLKPEMIAEYERLHNEIPAANCENMRKSGILALRIFRMETTLIMTITRDLSIHPPPGSLDEQAETGWRLVTGPCFAESWQEFPEIFTFEA